MLKIYTFCPSTHDIDVPPHALADANVLLLSLHAIVVVPVRTAGQHRRTGIVAILAQAQSLQVAVALVQAVAPRAVVAASVIGSVETD